MAKFTTYRFAFGTSNKPETSVWRINVSSREGDVYINNNSKSGNEIHFSFHKSGELSYKLGNNKRHYLEPAFKDDQDNYVALLIIFYPWDRPLKPSPASGKLDKINWLGTPPDDGEYTLEFKYVSVSLPFDNPDLIFPPIKARLFNKDMMLHVSLLKRKYTAEKLKTRKETKLDELDLNGGKMPEFGDIIRVGKMDIKGTDKRISYVDFIPYLLKDSKTIQGQSNEEP